ncbi:MAG TPA: dephospho-CoA kinase [bacterium]|nr:dephospho-CoA kinase [bacterium]
MSRPPVRIGLTGGIASGKSTVTAALRDAGAAVVDADRIAREVVAPGGPAYDDVVREFGSELVGPGGAIDRKALGARIFNDAAARRRLNALTHPHIRRRMAEDAARLAATPGVAVIVFEIPLLLDTTDGRDLGLDGIIVVSAPEDVQLDRLIARDGVSRDEARRRLAAQVPLRDKVAAADWVIDNSGTPDATRRQVERLWTTLTAKANLRNSSP